MLDDDGQPVMTSGNFAVVFKMKDIETGKFYALKCFTKEQEGRAEAYHQIADTLKNVDSPYLVSLRYLDKELFVDTEQIPETVFPMLLMDWVEGKTLDKYLRENLDNKYALELLAYRFSLLAQWLIPQPFAHGDLKPDNILVREDGTLVLVDYDGMFVPAMKGQKARELGSPDFRHPLRTEDDFDEHIDDFSIVSIQLSLNAVSYEPKFLDVYNCQDRLLFSANDYSNHEQSPLLKRLSQIEDKEVSKLYDLFIDCINNKKLSKNKIYNIKDDSNKRIIIHDRINESVLTILLIVYLSAITIYPLYLRYNCRWEIFSISCFVLLISIACYIIINIIDSIRPLKKYTVSNCSVSFLSTIGMLLVFIPILMMSDIFVEILGFMSLPMYQGEWYETVMIWIIWYFSFLVNGGIAFYDRGNDIKSLRRKYLRTRKEKEEDIRREEFYRIENEKIMKVRERLKIEEEKKKLEQAGDLPF